MSSNALVVEDDNEAAAFLSFALQACGYTVRVVPNAESALRAARTFVPDVVILDLGLPDRDGEELAQELREILPPRAPIVVVTGRSEAAPQTLQAIDVIMRKPIEGNVFTSLVSCARAKRSPLAD